MNIVFLKFCLQSMWHLIKYTAKLGPLGFFKVRISAYCIYSFLVWRHMLMYSLFILWSTLLAYLTL